MNSYGQRIETDNVKEGTLDTLVSGYPTHEFVIDLPEAQGLFEKVGPLTEDERVLAEHLERHEGIIRYPSDEAPPVILDATREFEAPDGRMEETDAHSSPRSLEAVDGAGPRGEGTAEARPSR